MTSSTRPTIGFTSLALTTSCFALLLVVAACGGGGDSGSTAPPTTPATPTTPTTPTAAEDRFHRVLAAEGDYQVFDSTVTTTLPTGVAPANTTTVRWYVNVDADASFMRVDTSSLANSRLRELGYVGGGALETTATGGLPGECRYAPAAVVTPPEGTLAGATFGSDSTVTCTDGAGTVTSTFTYKFEGVAIGTETVTVPAGTFQAFKFTQKATTQTATSTTVTDGAVWVDKASGRTVKVQNLNTSTPVSGATSNSSTTLLEMRAYKSGTTEVGPVVGRFVGTWSVELRLPSGVPLKPCGMTVSATGAVTVQCTSPDGSMPFTLTGTVAANGAVSMSSTTGMQATGTLGSPLGVGTTGLAPSEGTWTEGGNSGIWVAFHQ